MRDLFATALVTQPTPYVRLRMRNRIGILAGIVPRMERPAYVLRGWLSILRKRRGPVTIDVSRIARRFLHHRQLFRLWQLLSSRLVLIQFRWFQYMLMYAPRARRRIRFLRYIQLDRARLLLLLLLLTLQGYVQVEMLRFLKRYVQVTKSHLGLTRQVQLSHVR